MSTRCNIVIKEGRNKIYLYHHHDGYPEGVGALLKAWLKDKFPYGWKYKASFIANDLVKEGIPYQYKFAGEIVDTKDDEFEITTGMHGDIEYAYLIDTKAETLECYKFAGYGSDRNKIFKEGTKREIPDETLKVTD